MVIWDFSEVKLPTAPPPLDIHRNLFSMLFFIKKWPTCITLILTIFLQENNTILYFKNLLF